MFALRLRKSWFIAIAALLMVPALPACDTVHDWTRSGGGGYATVKNHGDNPLEDVTISAMPPAHQGQGAPAPSVYPVQGYGIPGNNELKVMTSKLSGGSVELYDLDSAAPVWGGSASGGAGYGGGQAAPIFSAYDGFDGMPLPSDPRVTVFPLDGAGPVAGLGGFSGGFPGGHAGGYAGAAPMSWGGAASAGGSSATPSSVAHGDAARIYFDHGSARIGPSGRTVLQDAANQARFAPVDRVRVEGHASSRVETRDPVEGRIRNLKESMNRAYEVSRSLIQQGVPAEKIQTVGWGDTLPSGGSEAEQRRVDVISGGR